MKACALCLAEKQLAISHLVPRAFLLSAKVNSPQLIKMRLGAERGPLLVNANWTERLLCSDCEKLLNHNYEARQIAYLRLFKDFKLLPDRITFTGFQSRRFYLLWLSILWRASVSSVEPFKEFGLGKETNEIMRLAIFHGALNIGGYDLRDFISIGLLRLAPDEIFSDATLPQMLSNIYSPCTGGVFYFFVEGWCVCYIVAENAKLIMPKNFGRIKDSGLFRVPVRKAADVPEVASLFDQLGAYAETHSGWRER